MQGQGSSCRFLGAVLLAAVLLPDVAWAADELHQDDLALFRETIEQMDQSADGKIDRVELELLVSELGLEMSDEDLDAILDAIAPGSSAEGVSTGELTPFAKTAAQYQEHAESGCISAPCANHGICQSRRPRGEHGELVPGDAQYACVCVSGWAGTHCEEDVDECASRPCNNGALCLDSTTDEDSIPNDEPLVPTGLFRCICLDYWGGLHCAEDTRDCLSAPCRNGGGCEPRPDGGTGRQSLAEPGFQCACAVGFAGLLCELDVLECASGPCRHDGTCIEPIPGLYKCQCRRGYTGEDCEEEVTHSPCDSVPCDNGGACTETTIGAGSHTLVSYKCTCLGGYAGMLCNFDLHECASEPCNNGGTCTEPVGGEYACTCAAGWGGQNCALTAREVEVDQEKAAAATAAPAAPVPAVERQLAGSPATIDLDTVGDPGNSEEAAAVLIGQDRASTIDDPPSLDPDVFVQYGASSSSERDLDRLSDRDGSARRAAAVQQDLVHINVATNAELTTIRDRLGTRLSTVLRGRSLKLLPQGALEGVLRKDLGDALGLLTAPCMLVLGDSTAKALAEATPKESGEDTGQRAGQEKDISDPLTGKPTNNQGGLQEKRTGGESERIEKSETASHIQEDQYVHDARAAAAARLAALAAAKQLRDDGHRVEDGTKPNDSEAPAVVTVDSKRPSERTVALSLDSAEHDDGVGVLNTLEQEAHLGVNEDGSVPNRAGPAADYQERFTIVRDRGQPVGSQQLPAKYNRVTAAKAKKKAVAAASPSPSPTPHILDEDEEDFDVDEGGHWDPALTDLLEQHRLLRLVPGLRALGVEEVLDLEDVTDAELESLGAKLVQVRRFRKALAQAQGQDTVDASSVKQEL